MEFDKLPPEFATLLDDIWHHGAAWIAEKADYPRYIELMRVMHRQLPPHVRDEMLMWPAMLGMARMVWRQTPHPALNYALAAAPSPERNAPCHCGSGHKYKQCCLPLEQSMPAADANFLPLLLDCLPLRRWRELAGSRISTDMVAHTAMELQRERRHQDVCTLLEPWFVDDADFHAKREAMFDTLLDAYTDLPRPRKKAKLLDRALAAGDRCIRSAALQRKATMHADLDDFASAWKLFGEAQRTDPQSPSLSHLETTLLLSEGRQAEARERARFWAHRLTAMRDPGLADLIAHMREIAEHGGQVVSQRLLDHEPGLRELHDAIKTAPPIASNYTLHPDDGQAGPLEPTPALREALQKWHELVSPVTHSPLFETDDFGDGDIDEWLPILRKHPQLWNAFEVLDVIVKAVRDRRIDMLSDQLLRPVLDRAVNLLREVLRANRVEGMRLEWGWLQNRPALSLLGDSIAIDLDKPMDDDRLTRMEWLVRTLNPNDNQGFRDWLMRAYLETDRYDDALALAAQYPHDRAAMQYNHVLALYAAAKPGLALAALRDAVEAWPKPLTWLLKDNPKAPAQGKWGIEVGGNEEAWLYRRNTLALWQRLGALDWLHQCAKAFKKRR